MDKSSTMNLFYPIALATTSFPITLIVPSLLFLFFFYKWRFAALSSQGKNLPPSPPRLPIIGNLHQLSTSGPYRSLKSLSKKYGEIMLLHLGSKPTLVVSSKEMASQVLKTHESCFSERTKLAIAKSAFYNCKEIFFSPYGEQWRSLRSLCMLKLFSVKRVKSFAGVRKEEVMLMIEKIKGSSVIDLSEMIFTLTNNLICRAAFGRKYSEGDGAGREFEELIGGVISVVGSNNIEDVLPWMGWINRFNGVNAKINRISKGFEDVIERIIEEQATRMKESTNQDSELDESSLQHFVDILLEVQRKNAKSSVPLDNITIKGVIFDMFAAGTHTNHVTLEWTFTELIRHPRVMQRLQEEVRGVAGAEDGVSEEDLESMPYLKAVIKESFRFHPAVPLPIPRECTQDVKLNGYDIAAGTQVIVNVWAIARDPMYWEEPDKFIPERFLDSALDFKGQHFELIPFGGGRRGCPAISFAIAGIELALANLVYWFDWSLPDGAKCESIDITESVGSISHKKYPLIVVPTPWVPK